MCARGANIEAIISCFIFSLFLLFPTSACLHGTLARCHKCSMVYVAPPPLTFWAVIGPAQEQLYSVYVYCVTGQALDKCSWFSWVNLSGQQHGVGVWTLLVFNKKSNNGDSNKPVVAKNCLWGNKYIFSHFFMLDMIKRNDGVGRWNTYCIHSCLQSQLHI